MQKPVVIVTQDLTRRFGEVVAVDGLTMEVYQGEIFGFLGHNGAGKTTTVRLLNGVLEPSAGSVAVLDLSPTTDGPALRRHTGVLTETPSLEERLTARENLAIFADLYGVPKAEKPERVEELLRLFDLIARGDDKVGGYSRGMKQRLALGRALIHNPEVLFLDEPTTGLDPVSARQVHEMILHMSRQEGRTVFLATHNLAEAQKLCDRVTVLEHGKVIALGTPAELARQFAPAQRLEIEVLAEEMPRAREVLGRITGITDLQVENNTLIASGVGRDMIPELIANLVSGGVRIYRVTPQEPSLEDVYFALQGKAERRA